MISGATTGTGRALRAWAAEPGRAGPIRERVARQFRVARFIVVLQRTIDRVALAGPEVRPPITLKGKVLQRIRASHPPSVETSLLQSQRTRPACASAWPLSPPGGNNCPCAGRGLSCFRLNPRGVMPSYLASSTLEFAILLTSMRARRISAFLPEICVSAVECSGLAIFITPMRVRTMAKTTRWKAARW